MNYTEIEMEGMKEILRDKEEENQTLKDKIEFLTNCLDDRDKSIAIMQEENEKLGKENRNLGKENRNLGKENRNLGKENFVMKDRLKFGYKGVTREEIERVEEENKRLESDLSLVIKERDDNIKQNKKLSEENGQLKKDLAFKNTMLDNVEAEYESSLNIIIKLNKRIKELEQCNLNLQTWIDNKEKVNKSMREELQRYKDMWDSGEF